MSDDLEDTRSEKTRRLYEELNSKINEYLHATFGDDDEVENGLYVDSWVLVMNYKNMLKTRHRGYTVEAYPFGTDPHAMKGLLSEGIDWVIDLQSRIGDDGGDDE